MKMLHDSRHTKKIVINICIKSSEIFVLQDLFLAVLMRKHHLPLSITKPQESRCVQRKTFDPPY